MSGYDVLIRKLRVKAEPPAGWSETGTMDDVDDEDLEVFELDPRTQNRRLSEMTPEAAADSLARRAEFRAARLKLVRELNMSSDMWPDD